MSSKKYFSGWNITIVICSVTTLLVLGLLFHYGYQEKETISLLIRTTAKISVTLFLLSFVASSLHYFLKNKWSRWILMNRRYLGVSFAYAHYLHLLFLVTMTLYINFNVFEDRGSFATIGGAIAYLFIALMTLTSFDVFRKKISAKTWNILHSIGSYYIFIVFAQSYLPRIKLGGIYLVIAITVVLAFLVKLAFVIKRKKL